MKWRRKTTFLCSIIFILAKIDYYYKYLMIIEGSVVCTAGWHLPAVVWPEVADMPQWFAIFCVAVTRGLYTLSNIPHDADVLIEEAWVHVDPA